jgi:hypothetical protein
MTGSNEPVFIENTTFPVDMPNPIVRWAPRSAKYTTRPTIVAEPEMRPPALWVQSTCPVRALMA